jgi:acyl phosphate:glycerol-3-phosphate acyltransferase
LSGYLVGSIPTAYLVVQFKWGRDIRAGGSGKVGAFNAYDVTKSRWTGILVGVLDFLKGLIVALTAGQILGGDFWLQSIALLGTIVGHNFPVWLRSRGGRGLASAAGGMFAIGMSFPFLWCVVWYIVYRKVKNVGTANLAAILLSPLILLTLPAAALDVSMIRMIPAGDYKLFAFLISAVHLLGYWEEIRNRIVGQK